MKVILTKKVSDDWSRIDIYQNCNHRIGTYYKRSGRLYTGDLDMSDKERFEKELAVDLSENSEFWTTFHVKIDSKNKVVLHTENIEDEFKVKFLQNHKDIALGYNDKKPGTKYVLIKEQDEAETVNKKAQSKIKAITEYSKLTPEQMRKVLRLFGHNANNSSNEVIQSTLYQLIENDPDKFIKVWIENKDKDTHFLIEEAVANNIIRNNKTIYKYGTDVIGYTLDEAVDYLKDPKNTNLRLAILAQLDGKKEIEAPIQKRSISSQFESILTEIEKEEAEVIKNEAKVKNSTEKTSSENKEPNKKTTSSTKKVK